MKVTEEDISRPLKMASRVIQTKPWLEYHGGKKNTWFLFSGIYLSENGNMLHFFLTEAKVGILENEKDCVQYKKLVARHKFWGLCLRRMLNALASEVPLLLISLLIAFPPVLLPLYTVPFTLHDCLHSSLCYRLEWSWVVLKAS